MSDTEVLSVSIDRGRHTVLVVDDHASTRYSTSRFLRAAGFQVMEAGSGTEAIERSERGVSAVVLDVHLPDIDGFNVCRLIRARPTTENLPIVHLSATHVASEDRVAGLNAGADAYMVHPAEPAVLIATIQALIRARTAEDKLRRSEQRFRAIYDQAQSGIALLDADGRIADANPAMLRFLGRPREEVLNSLLADFAPADWRGSVTEQARSAGLVNSTAHGAFPLATPDGKPMFLDWTFSLPIEDGLRVAIASDVSERHELEQRRRDVLEREQAARALAEQHSRTKDNFIAVLSHELRTPLNSIVGWVAILTRRNPTPEALKGLQAIERNVKAQARIISDILDVSRINSGKMRLEMEQVQPAEVIRNALTALQTSLDEKSIRVDEDLDNAGGPVWMDPNRYEQVVWNLMTNAIKFSDREGTVHVRLERLGDILRLSVRDHGQGIAPEFVPRLFDRFSQSDEPGNRRHGGLGLGLAIVRHLVELHGGTVAGYSAGIGRGATMTVDIPAGPPSEPITDFESSELGADKEGMAALPLQGLDILVVEDDAGASEMLSVVLSDRGAAVRTASDYEGALTAITQRWPDALISDIGLPGRDGHELIRAVRRLVPPHGVGRLAAVALTAFARPEDRQKAIDAGFDAHVAKPLKPHALVTTVLALAPVKPKSFKDSAPNPLIP